MKKICRILMLLAFVVSLGKDVIESQINGQFEGFKHGNVYELMNGQVWQQIDSSYSLNHLYVPRVAIFERDGYFYMKVYGMDGEVAVQQLE